MPQSHLDYANELIRKKSAEIVTLRREIKGLHREEETAGSIRELAYGLAAEPLQPPKWLYRPEKVSSLRDTPVTIWSDIHYGEVINPREIGGVNSFNTKIAAQRVQRLAEKVVDLSFNHMGRAKKDYPGIVVCLGGDMIGGDIHEELARTNERTALQCCRELANILVAALSLLGQHFKRVSVVGVVGNHGRITAKPSFKQRTFHNYDWFIYTTIEQHFQGNKKFAFSFEEEADAHFQVHNHRFVLTHGDSLGVRGGDGLIGAIGPIMRGRIKIGAAEAQIGRDFDTLLIGHWHTAFDLPDCIANGAVKGYDEYARLQLRAKYAPAQQWLFFVNPKYGITARWPVFLQDPISSRPRTNEWVSIWKATATG